MIRLFRSLLACAMLAPVAAVAAPSVPQSAFCEGGMMRIELIDDESVRVWSDDVAVRAVVRDEDPTGVFPADTTRTLECPMSETTIVQVSSDPFTQRAPRAHAAARRTVTLARDLAPGRPGGLAVQARVWLDPRSPAQLVVWQSSRAQKVVGGRSGAQTDLDLDGDGQWDVLATGITGIVLHGSGRDDVISLAGRGRIPAVAVPATVYGGRGNDRISGGKAANRLVGGAGRDTLYAKNGRSDRVEGEGGYDGAQVDAADRVNGIERRWR